MTLAYLSAEYFEEIVYRIENNPINVIINVADPEKWLEEFKKAKPIIKSIELTHISGKKYGVSANI